MQLEASLSKFNSFSDIGPLRLQSVTWATSADRLCYE